MTTPRPRVAILMTSFNRREVTLRSLAALQAAVAHVSAEVFLVDDLSTDGTAAAAASLGPSVHVIAGTGALYWNGGMRLAWHHAIRTAPDYYLWLNDDLELTPDAIDNLLATWRAQVGSVDGKLIVCGKTISASSGAVTYGGYARASRVSRLRFRRLNPGEPPLCATMNGNCVLVPSRAITEIGLNCGDYVHAFGDNDYGLRATRAGYCIVECSTPVGFQESNKAYGEATACLTLRNWRFIFFDPKGVPLKEWLTFCRKHGGWLWPVNFIWRYFRMAMNGLRRQTV